MESSSYLKLDSDAALMSPLDFVPKFANCSCCGHTDYLRPMVRPDAESLDDDELLKMAEELGEEATQQYFESTRRYGRTYECETCRDQTDAQFFILVSIREDR